MTEAPQAELMVIPAWSGNAERPGTFDFLVDRMEKSNAPLAFFNYTRPVHDASLLDEIQRLGLIYYVIVEKTQKTVPLAIIGLYERSKRGGIANLFFISHIQVTSPLYKDMLNTAVVWAFNEHDLHKLKVNLREDESSDAVRVFTDRGFKIEGVLKRDIWTDKNDKYLDKILLGLFKEYA